MHGSGGDEWVARGRTGMVFLTLGVLCGATALSVFGFAARLVWWRERERGIRAPSYFLAATTVNLVGECAVCCVGWGGAGCYPWPAELPPAACPLNKQHPPTAVPPHPHPQMLRCSPWSSCPSTRL